MSGPLSSQGTGRWLCAQGEERLENDPSGKTQKALDSGSPALETQPPPFSHMQEVYRQHLLSQAAVLSQPWTMQREATYAPQPDGNHHTVQTQDKGPH